MRRPIAHAVILPNCSGYCGIPPDSAFRTKPKSVGSWQLTAASLPMSCQKQLPYPELVPCPRSSPQPKIGLNGHTKTQPLFFNWDGWKDPAPEIPMRLTEDSGTTTSQLNFFFLCPSCITLPCPSCPMGIDPKSINFLKIKVKANTTQNNNKNLSISCFIFQGPWYIQLFLILYLSPFGEFQLVLKIDLPVSCHP